jgi:hypothetical protein
MAESGLYWRLDGSGLQRFDLDKVSVEVPVYRLIPRWWRDGSVAVKDSSEMVLDPTFDVRVYRLIADKTWVRCQGGGFQEVARSDVIRDLEENGLPLPPELSRASTTTRTNPHERKCDRQIIETLRAVGHRLTTSKVLSAMEKRGSIPSESTVKKRLAVMAGDGRLTKDPNANPKGYGLPEWNGSSGS